MESVETPVPEQVNPYEHLGLDANGEPLKDTPEENAQEAAPQEPKEGQPPVEPEEKKNRFQELILRRKEAEAKAREVEEALGRERAERERFQKELESLRTKPASEDKPLLENFDSVAEWQDALTEWQEARILKRIASEREQEVAKTREAEARAKADALVRDFQQAEDAYKAKLGEKARDYDAATANLRHFMGNGLFRDALLRTSPEVVHHVAADLELADRLASASPEDMLMELGALKARLGDKGREGRRFSSAPAPEPHVSGLRANPAVKDYGNMSGEEYARTRDAEIAEQRKRQGFRR